MAANPIPQGYRTVTPYLYVKDAARFIDFLKTAFGAVEHDRMPGPDGTISHASLQIGDSRIMLSERDPMPSAVFLYVPDVDATFRKAVAAGAKAQQEPSDQFWGDRYGSVRDEWGIEWQIATHVEDLTPEEMMKRASAMGSPS